MEEDERGWQWMKMDKRGWNYMTVDAVDVRGCKRMKVAESEIKEIEVNKWAISY